MVTNPFSCAATVDDISDAFIYLWDSIGNFSIYRTQDGYAMHMHMHMYSMLVWQSWVECTMLAYRHIIAD